jgi:hypothetical protein
MALGDWLKVQENRIGQQKKAQAVVTLAGACVSRD